MLFLLWIAKSVRQKRGRNVFSSKMEEQERLIIERCEAEERVFKQLRILKSETAAGIGQRTLRSSLPKISGDAEDIETGLCRNSPKLPVLEETTMLIGDALDLIHPRLLRDLEAPPVLAHMLSNNCITIEEYKQIQTQAENRDQVEALLDIVEKRGIRHMYKLVQALQLHQSKNKLDKVVISVLASDGTAQLPVVVETPSRGLGRLPCFSVTGQLNTHYFERLGDVLFDYGVILTSAKKGSLRMMLLCLKLEVLLMFVDAFNDRRVPQAMSAVLLGEEENSHTFMPLIRSSINADDVVNAARQLGSSEQDLPLLRKRHLDKVPLEGGFGEEGGEGRHAELNFHMSTLMSSLPYKVNKALLDRRLISYDEYMMTSEKDWYEQNKMMYRIALSKTEEAGVREAVCQGLCQSSQYCPFAPAEILSQPLTASEHDELLSHIRPRLEQGHDVPALLDRMKADEVVDGFMRDWITAPVEQYRKADRLLFYVSHLHRLAYGKFRRAFRDFFPWVLPE